MLHRPAFVGFFPKRITPVPEPLAALGVERVASVSQCMAPGPPNWIEAWTHNDFGFYDAEDVAWRVVDRDPGYEMFAYELYPFRFGTEGEEGTAPAAEVGGGIPPGFVFLGVDVVSRSSSDFFECSPLSCNLAAREFTANADCLAADVETASRYARAFAAAGTYEPGHYHLIRVWGQRRP